MAGRPQEVSRRGKPAVVVISSEEYRRLLREAKGRRESFADHVLSFPGEGIERSKVTPRDVEF
ncbi:MULTISPECIES: type II toxin-antitoxin system prevent-host-death family antitoxin [Stappiaceae]